MYLNRSFRARTRRSATLALATAARVATISPQDPSASATGYRRSRKTLLAKTALLSTLLSFVGIAMASIDASAQTIPATSPNWAGYVAAGQGPYTYAYGSWTVPTANCGTVLGGEADANEYTWVGLDGFGSSTVEQIGTETDCWGWTGSYSAFFEFAPNGPEVITSPFSYHVNPGDLMQAWVQYNGPTSGTYTLTLDDDTQPWSFSVTKPWAGNNASAECIAEDPQGSPLLTNFGSVTMNCYVEAPSVGSTPARIGYNGEFEIFQLNMVTNGTLKATTSPLWSNMTNFTVTYDHD
jgi:Peptidase A4 family